MKNRPVARLRTPGVLAADLDVPLHRVLYVLQTRDHIKPSARAGRLRLYDREALALRRSGGAQLISNSMCWLWI